MLEKLIPIIALIASLVMHEVAHGVASMLLGDPTPVKQNRITLNPLKHLDLLGTLFPALMILSGSPFIFGWAKPVPVNPRYYKNFRQGFAIVAFAGPLVNFVLALISAGLFRLIEAQQEPVGSFLYMLGIFFIYSTVINMILGCFNLIPVPPMDGSRIIQLLFPRKIAWRWFALDKYGFAFVFLLIFFFRAPIDFAVNIAYSIATSILGISVI
ncbi:site-2 protease family protein [bacterium]|nr:site-2 protease family protein [bacterium]|tara:strand:+ start:812 stop:1450 length:639 start_codon:yes stop_codon:yes gene_type:complete